MLFAVKKRVTHILACTAVLALFAAAMADWLGLDWTLSPAAPILFPVTAGIAVILLSDGLLHAVFWLLIGHPYRRCYRAQVHYFSGQSRTAILLSGFCAGAEELLFRGVLLESLLNWGPWMAVLMSGTAFGAAHLIPRRQLWPFGIWAAWQGVLLGALYVWTGDLLANVIVHGMHDVVGFTVFRIQGREAWGVGLGAQYPDP